MSRATTVARLPGVRDVIADSWKVQLNKKEKLMDINKAVFEQIATGHCIFCTHMALLPYAEELRENESYTLGINEFSATYQDSGLFLIDLMKKSGFVTDDINADILSTNVKTVPIDHQDWPALVDEDANTLALLNALVLWRRGIATDEDVIQAIQTFKQKKGES